LFRRIVFTLAAVTALLAGTAGAASAALAGPSGPSTAQAQSLQQRVDTVLSTIPGGRQVSPTVVKYDGLTVTVDPHWSGGVASPAAISCSDGWFCIVVNGTSFAFYTCQTWTLSNWTGNAPYNNNQSSGTVARAYAQNGTTVVWSNTAKSSGTVNVSPWWYFRPC
jgi:hypothetical protein